MENWGQGGQGNAKTKTHIPDIEIILNIDEDKTRYISLYM